eukprot:TRINITY_DN8890_c0_g1_i6.p1 TRINITY_DN8890_c0_g1~~TRINITY_DN8890_c0_g1_i6.p1  ORF type:complete len:269 (+),score=37.24 TRINITY_DN8890_c0_g1_i6:100-807(+)
MCIRDSINAEYMGNIREYSREEYFMERDYAGSKKYSKEFLESLDIKYTYQDSCVDDYVAFVKCSRENPRLLENGLFYALPFSTYLTKCGVYKTIWKKCQDYRENEIYEEMRKIYLDNLKKTRGEQALQRSPCCIVCVCVRCVRVLVYTYRKKSSLNKQTSDHSTEKMKGVMEIYMTLHLSSTNLSTVSILLNWFFLSGFSQFLYNVKILSQLLSTSPEPTGLVEVLLLCVLILWR